MKNRIFQEYVTGSHFRIDLSRPMIQVLCGMSEGYSCVEYSRVVPTMQCLLVRGLVIHKAKKGFFLTRAGELIVELLKEAGLYEVPKEFTHKVA